MSSYCEDCGTKTYSGICSNCHEELAIIEWQGDCITEPLSKEFTDKAKEQRKQVDEIRGKS